MNATPPDPANAITMWVIYERPFDHPQGFVTRRHVNGVPDAKGFGYPTLEAARQFPLYYAFTNIGRMEKDEPQIVEVWV